MIPQRLKFQDASASGQKITEGQVVSLIGQDASIFPYMSPFLCTSDAARA